MKKLTMLVLLVGLTLTTFAHTLTNDCWNGGTYSISATQGDGNGKIEVTVYTNSNMNSVVQATRSFVLNSSGAVGFTVNQPNRTTKVFVYVRWFYRSGGTYFPVTWNSGQGYPNSYSSIQTGTNQCSVVALNDYEIKAKINSNTLYLLWETRDYTSATIESSADSRSFKTISTVSDNTILRSEIIMLNTKQYYRVKFVKFDGSFVYSNVVFINYSKMGLDYSKPYNLYVYSLDGRMIANYNNVTQYKFQLTGTYLLKYVQKQGDSSVVEIIPYKNGL